MTDKLRAAADRLRRYIYTNESCTDIYGVEAMDHRLAALDERMLVEAYLAEHPAVKEETVRVRAAVWRDLGGRFIVRGYGVEIADELILDEGGDSWKHVAWIDADIPLPSVPTVQGQVVEQQQKGHE